MLSSKVSEQKRAIMLRTLMGTKVKDQWDKERANQVQHHQTALNLSSLNRK